MIDRLKEYRSLLERRDIKLSPPPAATIVQIESDEMKEFTSLVSRGNTINRKIIEETEKLEEAKRNLTNAVGGKEDKLKEEIGEINSNLEVLRRDGKEVADKMKVVANNHKEKMKELAIEKKNADYGSSEIRIVANLNGAFLNNFSNAISQSETVSSDIKNIQKKKLIRSAETILGRDLNDQEKQEYIEDPSRYQQLVENKLTQGKGHILMQNKVRDLEARNEEIKKLENVSLNFCY